MAIRSRIERGPIKQPPQRASVLQVMLSCTGGVHSSPVRAVNATFGHL